MPVLLLDEILHQLLVRSQLIVGAGCSYHFTILVDEPEVAHRRVVMLLRDGLRDAATTGLNIVGWHELLVLLGLLDESSCLSLVIGGLWQLRIPELGLQPRVVVVVVLRAVDVAVVRALGAFDSRLSVGVLVTRGLSVWLYGKMG